MTSKGNIIVRIICGVGAGMVSTGTCTALWATGISNGMMTKISSPSKMRPVKALI